MNLYLIQHGKAFSKVEDPERRLTKEGKKETEHSALSLKNKGITVKEIWHSKKLRSIETAGIIGKIIDCKELKERDGLNPGDPVKKTTDEIGKKKNDLIIVGHLPFLQKLASSLLTEKESLELIVFIYSAVLCLTDKNGPWQIAWYELPGKPV